MFIMRAYRVALTLLAVLPLSVTAQEPEPEFAKHLFPPELVMQNQQAIRLTSEQRTSITQGIRDFQLRVVELQWKMQDEAEKLNQLVQESRVDEAATIAQVDRVLDVERQIKRAHMGLLVRIKNTLTPAQQDTLAVMRPAKRRD
jgi:Spy/CpxP family protein refolding chaperone